MNKIKYAFFSFVSILLILHFSTSPVIAGITNGDFSIEPDGIGWTYSHADVYSNESAWNGNGYAFLRPELEEEASLSELFQDNIFLLPNETQLSFDIEMETSGGVHETDIFTASFDTQEYIFYSSDFSGTFTFNLTGWEPGPYILSFKLLNDPDSVLTTVNIDNVRFVPVPGAFLLAIIGLLSAAASRKLKA